MSKVILVSNRLPIRITDTGEIVRTTGGLASALEAMEGPKTNIWVGWSGQAIEEIEKPELLKTQMRALQIQPVLLSAEEIDGFYEGYSNATLWPLLHSMSQRATFDTGAWKHYRTANEKFAQAVLEVVEEGDTVWVHDYHLFLLPALLREAIPSLKIGFFLHTPFPSSDIFRILPECKEVLHGLLGADLIGFHTFNYLRHFRSSLLRVLGIEAEHESLYHKGRCHKLGVYPIGHNREGFHAAMDTPLFEKSRRDLIKSLNGRKLILNVERLDYTKGVLQKLGAIRHFLASHPEKCDELDFVIIAVPSRQNVAEYTELTEEVQRKVGAINGEFGTIHFAPINFLHQSFPIEELAAFYSVADACMVTPLVDGMNLVAKEFIDCKTEGNGSRPGVLILSEFAGAAAEMSHALLVNPYATRKVSEAIAQALEMPNDECWDRTRKMQQHLEVNDAGVWAKRFLSYFDEMPPPLASSSDLTPVHNKILSAVKQGKRCSLFLDYDGTLRDFTLLPQDAVPDDGLLPLLKRLGEKVDITIVSGRPLAFLDEHFGGTGFNLVAEHGYRWSRNDSPEWELLNPHVDTSWKEQIAPQLEQITQLTPGSHIEEKPSSIVWHYRGSDPEFGLWQARRLLAELTDITANLPVAVHHGKKIVEIASLQVNKGRAVESLISSLGSQVALAAGDDQTDETMFALEPDIESFHTIHLGGTDTRATYVTRISRFRDFLEDVANSID
jgi:trehalose 6-phosphate synthase/phosphatase